MLLLSSAFRPFYFLGTLYAVLLVAVWTGSFLGLWDVPSVGTPLRLWHGHEMIFGFAAAIIAGIVLTALPSWAGTEEICGGRLALLVLLWLLGRIAFWAAPWLPALAPAMADLLLFPAVFLMVTPQLWRASNRLYLLLLPILLALAAANAAYHYGILAAHTHLAGLGLRGAIYAIIVLYVLKGGVLTPIFSGNALREKGRGEQAPFNVELDMLAVGVVLLLAALDLAGARPLWTGLAALACAGVHAVRTARWRGWLLADVPLVFVMHLGFAWLVFAFALKAIAELTGWIPESAWLHAFTLGSLGMMMLGLMTRVSLRHTGRPLVVPGTMKLAYGMMFAAALIRLAATVHGLGDGAVALAAVLWGLTFLLCFATFGAMLVRPSLPRKDPST
ncbi:MAG: NnrS family protein [Betaproteobacteria bacterium]|nr:NnrS family protein [Betaproteobacteria bacterium]